MSDATEPRTEAARRIVNYLRSQGLNADPHIAPQAKSAYLSAARSVEVAAVRIEAEAAQGAAPLDMSCDRIVNNGMGEPTECGRSYPCDLHDEGAAPRAEGLDVERLLEVAMTARRMVEDGHPDSPEWFRIMSERLSTVMDLTDAALMDGVDAVVARLSRPSDERVPESEER